MILKTSSLEKNIENFLLFSVLMQFFVCSLLAIFNRIFLINHPDLVSFFKIDLPKSSEKMNIILELFITFMRWVLIST